MDPAQKRLVEEYKADGLTWPEIGEYLDEHPEKLRSAYRRATQSEPGLVQHQTLKRIETVEGATVESPKSTRITTLAHLVDASEIDLDEWLIERHVINKWEVGAKDNNGEIRVEPLWQVKAWMKPRQIPEEREAILEVLDQIRNHVPPQAPAPVAIEPVDSHLLEITPYDLHMGSLAWWEETGTDYNLEIAKNIAQDAIERLLGYTSGFPTGRILLPLGNDLMHVDRTDAGKGGYTHRGTQQDVAAPWIQMFRETKHFCVWLIDRLSQIAPVDVIIVPGNHDSERMFTMGELLDAWYRGSPRVSVYNTPDQFKYYTYGATMLGFCHGHEFKKSSKYFSTMANDRPGDWARCPWREWHVGHIHIAQMTEEDGVRIRTLPSIAGKDRWHRQNGYHSIRAMDALVWHEERSFVGQLTAHLNPEV